ncbi:chalcone-flavanone isomerase [Xylaria bambusicola]|uniref:chalcone-flavanone isomerase n=1 Tax=Xylaria bambusicola TaxID=326684 RepID=UPI00200825CA|nr:chalcone-flavanone isomerase [Xylaria bambusicola]KAI0517474.1 chalcone-flavanone isomerase [Xylaria bambusicola]
MRAVRSLPSTPLLRSPATGSRLPFAPRVRCLQKHPFPVQRRTFLRGRQQSSGRVVENLNLNRLRDKAYNYHVRRRNFLLCGVIAGVFASCYTAYLLSVELRKPKKLDSGLPDKADPFTTEAGVKRKTVLHDAEGREIVPTGNSTVPTFPRLIDLAVGAEEGQEKLNGVEYTLVGLGVRTVTFLGFEVYMVGYYMATQDIAAVQARLVKEINPIATTLVPSEKETLRKALLDPEHGEKLWNSILKDIRPRSLFRIIPVRDTDFHHLRDGFVRAITARTQGNNPEFGDEAFGLAMKDFKSLFNRGKVPKSRELLLCRDAVGRLTVTYDDGKTGMGSIGRVVDERVSRLLWLNYLAGKAVASEPARKNIVDGIMEFVERPIGTVATRVI